uniref:Ig-like domain-containing protein n=1 Tax=Chrysemys picta bellii TaxID=8478 RepID=A0A8C3I5V3_CHRPI
LNLLLINFIWGLLVLSGFTLAVPQLVSVQEGLCVLIPCTFTYPASYDTYNSWAQLFRYWYKDPAIVDSEPPVASTDSSRRVSQETQGRFRLAGDLLSGDCSLQISDAQQTDAGRYFFRFEKGTLKYNYRKRSCTTLLAGEPVTVTCTAPGRCSGTPPRVTWTGPFSDTAQDVSAPLANGTWAHSSVLSFTPTLGDHGKELICSTSYRPSWGPSTRRTIQLHVALSHPPAELTARGHGDIVSLETQEGDSLNLSCEAGSRPEATLSWARTNRSLIPGQGGDWHLELPNLSRGDAGEYRCWAKNSYGSASRALRVHVQSKALGGSVPPGSGQGFSAGVQGAGLGLSLGQPMRSAQQGGCKSLPGVSALLLIQDHKTPATHRTKDVQDGAATAQAPLGPREPDELQYASISFSKLQRKGGEPSEDPDTEYSEVRLK